MTLMANSVGNHRNNSVERYFRKVYYQNIEYWFLPRDTAGPALRSKRSRCRKRLAGDRRTPIPCGKHMSDTMRSQRLAQLLLLPHMHCPQMSLCCATN